MGNRVYFNRAQMEAMAVGAHEEYIIGGRGLGKSEGFDARNLLRNAQAMPRSTGALLSPSYSKLKTQTFPAIANALARWGYIMGTHYVVGVQPPRDLHYAPPRYRPQKAENVIQFYNGTVVQMVSFDRAMSANSMSLDWVIGPEAKFLPYDRLRDELIPAIRGGRQFYGACPWHGGQCYSTDMPTGARGRWILDKAKDMDEDKILYIKLLYLDYMEAVRQWGRAHGETAARRARLDAARREAVFFAVYTALDNLEVLGEEWFRAQRRNLREGVFNSSIMSREGTEIASRWYAALEEDTHCYRAESTGFAEAAPFGLEGNRRDCRWDGDLAPGVPLLIALDYNTAISTMVVGQRIGDELRTLKSLFVKNPSKLRDLIGAFGRYYRYHSARDVYFYYDHTAVWTSSVTNESQAEAVMGFLREEGFNPVGQYLGQAEKHASKFAHINAALGGMGEYPRLRFNEENCETLIAAMLRAQLKKGAPGGGAKNKSNEKTPDTPENPDELKTHITDAWDTLFMGGVFQPPGGGGGGVVSAFI